MSLRFRHRITSRLFSTVLSNCHPDRESKMLPESQVPILRFLSPTPVSKWEVVNRRCPLYGLDDRGGNVASRVRMYIVSEPSAIHARGGGGGEVG